MAEKIDDLIVARATAATPAALAVVRIDGAGTDGLVERLFLQRHGPGPTARPRRMILGEWIDPDGAEPIDHGQAVYYAAPASYTGNDAAEFFCHGGPIPTRRLIEAAIQLGARLAEPGEFTRRAFLNGRMDLAQAEAVADLVNAQTSAAARLAQRQLAGGLSDLIRSLREETIGLAAEIESRIDFPEEDLEPQDRRRLTDLFERIGAGIERLAATRRRGQLVREGARVALVGRPNVGKSSLFNALLRIERAIVTPHPGTTRDTIECTIDLESIPLTLVDTAGLRASDDPVERLGIERTHLEMERADLVILIEDATTPDAGGREELVAAGRAPDLVVANKIDLPAEAPPTVENVIPISATRGDGLDRLEREILARLDAGAGTETSSLAINLRHDELLRRTATALGEAQRGFEGGLSGDLVMIDLREALDALSAIVGLEVGDAILDRIFSRFCIGK